MANNGKGVGPNRLGASKGSITSPAKIAPLLAMAGKAVIGSLVSKAVSKE
tara:strand:+ start:27 stop:176 length:150 start_codon:yes stop_codon:yes gene_type:complete